MKLESSLPRFCELLIRDLRVWPRLGCSLEEKFHPQMVSIDVSFVFKLPPIGSKTDQLRDTVCYLEIVREIEYLVKDRQFNLIEHFTYSVHMVISKLLAQKLHTVYFIRVSTNKIAPPVPGIHGGVLFTYSSNPFKREE